MKAIRVYTYKYREMSKFFYVLGIGVLMMSCGKDIDLFIPRGGQLATGDISRLKTRLHEDLRSDISYTIQIPCTGDRVFQVDKDLVLVIPPDFVDLSAYPCNHGYFDMDVTVCDTKGEILVAGIPTISEGLLLESRIEFNLRLRDGESGVKLAHGKQIRILVKDPDPRDRMELFYGNADNSGWLQADQNPATWSNVENTEWWIQQDSQIFTGIGYECFSDSTDWINVDVFFSIPEENRTPVCIDLPDEFSNTNTQVFMVFDDYNSVVNMPGDATQKIFCESYGSTPVGFRVTFVVIAEISEGSYRFASKSTTIQPNHHETLEPVNVPYEEIKNYLRTL
jgi:hypothetical protein